MDSPLFALVVRSLPTLLEKLLDGNLNDDSDRPFSFTVLYIEFQLIVWLSSCDYTVLLHSQPQQLL